MICKLSYNKDKYGEKVEKTIEDVTEIQETKSGIIRFVVNLDGHILYKEFKKNDTMKIEISMDE
jgi:hypothetical protein